MNLVADIGGTTTRLALIRPGHTREGVELLALRKFTNDEFPDLKTLVLSYLEACPVPGEVEHGAFCVAAPVLGDSVEMLNRSWRFSISTLRDELQLTSLKLVNDFAALAMALPFLPEDQVLHLGGGKAISGAAIGVLGPGTGLGVSGLVPHSSGWSVLHGEGGHVTLPCATEAEWQILQALQARFGHVSAERVLCGAGLAWLYDAMSGETLGDSPSRSPATVSEGEDDFSRAVVNQFLAFLGTVAGDLALTLGAWGGIYLGGGVAHKLAGRFPDSPFRERFEAKGRYAAQLATVPTWLITHDVPALLGLAALLDGEI